MAVGTGSNGHQNPRPSSYKKRPITSTWPCPPKVGLVACLSFLVIATVVIDNYYIWWSNALESSEKINRKHAPPNPSRSLHGRGTQRQAHDQHPIQGGKYMSRRKFAFQDANKRNNLPTLKKANRNIKEVQNKQAVPPPPPVAAAAAAAAEPAIVYGKEPILRIFQQAGIPPLEPDVLEMLPTWDQIIKVVGPQPVIVGLDRCQAFRETVPAVERMLGSSGMFNSGTNLVTHLLKKNCKIPERVEKYGWEASREAHGMRWQVPWGKHSPAKYKEAHSTEKAKAINKEWIMPVVTIRHPYTWMGSMCKNGYTAKWVHQRKGPACPNLKLGGEWNHVSTKFAEGRMEHSQSLAHLWNDWYKMYIEDAAYPRLIVRLEDLMFHSEETTTKICNCVGGTIRSDRNFTYVLDSAKADSPGHDASTGFVQAWIKYSKPIPPRGKFRPGDYEAAKEALNPHYMKLFQYEHPPPGEPGRDEEVTDDQQKGSDDTQEQD